jgi:hypothetical protein
VTKAKLIAGLGAVIALAAAAPASADILPVGAWGFNEGRGTTIYDTSFHGHNGSLQGSPTFTQGRFAKALSFGGGDAVLVPNDKKLEGQNLTVSAWVNSSSAPGPFKYIVGKGANGCVTGSYGLYTGPSTAGGIAFYVATSSSSFVMSPDGGSGIWDGNWHNVIGTYDGSTVRLYVDGQQVGSGSADGAPVTYGLASSNDVEIGNVPTCPGLGFTGKIDEAKVFNRALGSQEIRAAYQASKGLPPIIPFDLVL